MWRWMGGVLQPMLGSANYLLGPTKPALKPIILPTGVDPIPPTPIAELDAIVSRLDDKKQAWADLGPAERAKLIRQCLAETSNVSKEAAEVAVKVKGSYGYGLGEEWMVWLAIVWILRHYAEALEADGEPRPNGVSRRKDGQYVVDTFALGMEALFFGGVKGEVWIEPGKKPTQGRIYREKREGKPSHPGVSLVLGAGNQVVVAATDILQKLIVDDSVVVCKMNPVNEFAGPYIRKAFSPLVDAGFLEVVYGGGDVGKFLCEHPKVDSIHLTGAAATFDAIVWGPDNPKKEGEPKCKKEVAAELGCVTPYIIVPGDWTDDDLNYYADELVAGLVHNAGHNCLKAEIVLTDAEWPLRRKFIDAVRKKLDVTPRRVAWYPGSEKKAAAFRQAFPDVEKLGCVAPKSAGSPPPAYIPWMFRPGLSPDEAVLNVENWCGALQEVGIPGCGGDAGKFMTAATKFANERCWGTLSCAVFVPPAAQEIYPDEFDAMIAGLKYGSINVNVATVVGFTLPSCTWGAFPGNPIQDIGSGNCAVHNTLLLDYPQKSVVRAPWRFYPTHLWSPHNRNLEAAVSAALWFFRAPSIPTLIPPALQALRG